MQTFETVLMVLGWMSAVLIPLLIFIVSASYGLRSAIHESLKDGKIDSDELQKILEEANKFVQLFAKYLMKIEV